MSFRPQVSQFEERQNLIDFLQLQVQRADQPVRLGSLSGLQLEQGPSDVEATRRAKPETTEGTSELQQSAFLTAAAEAAANIAAAAFQQLFPFLGHFFAAVLPSSSNSYFSTIRAF